MEADFNAMNKEVYGVQMLDTARKYKLMPEEMFSKKNRMADDGGLAKTLLQHRAADTIAGSHCLCGHVQLLRPDRACHGLAHISILWS